MNAQTMTLNRLILIAFLTIGSYSFAQKNAADPRLLLRFSQDQINQMDDSRIAYWTYYLDHSFKIVEIPAEKADALAGQLEEISLPSGKFHGFSMDLSPYQKEGAYLRIKDQSSMLIVKPMATFITEFNQHQSLKK